ncbi:phage tail assembly chaperone [Sphingomonas sp.]|uniref:phage tail assembly chaperone n=1 Tax=Sphingomonas sp. TaxID=28214 RepID=UPI0025EB91C8|nr:phage tail assembly chaperone [Sphingomonas sp.]MBV9529254.1 phage tail assembly chaperone [Sphingomonas sp.]
MTAKFGNAASRLCGAASTLLGWRPDEFWNATPAELATALAPPEHSAEPMLPDVFADLRQRFPDD